MDRETIFTEIIILVEIYRLMKEKIKKLMEYDSEQTQQEVILEKAKEIAQDVSIINPLIHNTIEIIVHQTQEDNE
jgi:hypothetical protein